MSDDTDDRLYAVDDHYNGHKWSIATVQVLHRSDKQVRIAERDGVFGYRTHLTSEQAACYATDPAGAIENKRRELADAIEAAERKLTDARERLASFEAWATAPEGEA